MKINFVSLLIALSLLCSASFTADVYAANGEMKIGIMEFSSGTMDVTEERAVTVGDVFTKKLAEYAPVNIKIIGHRRLKQIAEYNHLATEGYISARNAVKAARAAGCKYIITGIVTELTSKKASRGIDLKILKFGRNVEAVNAAVDLKMTDTETGKSILLVSDSSKINRKDNTLKVSVTDAVFSLSGIPGGSSGGDDSGKSDLNVTEAAALYILSSKLSLRVIEKVTGIYPKVSSVSKKEVTLNTGTDEGSRVGMLYRVYRDNAGKEENIAVVKVKEVRSDYSKAVLYAKGYGDISLVKEGDKVFPADTYEAKALVKAKTFSRKKGKNSAVTDSNKDNRKDTHAKNRRQEAGNRKQETGNRRQETGKSKPEGPGKK